MNTPAWQSALDRLVHHPVLTPAQVRHLVSRLGAPRADVLGRLAAMLGSTRATDAADAAFVLGSVLEAGDRAWVTAFAASAQPLAVRAWLRTLYQDALLSGRIKDDEAAVDVPAAERVDFLVEDAVRELGDVPQLLTRARVAAEWLVGDAPLDEADTPRAVQLLVERLGVPASAVWAELLVHPFSRPAVRAQARSSLEKASGPAAPVLERAMGELLEGDLRRAAAEALSRHRADAGTHVHARVSGADGTGAFAMLVSVLGAEPRAFGGTFSQDPARCLFKGASGAAAAESVEAWAWRQAQAFKGFHAVPVDVALGLAFDVVNALPPKAGSPREGALALLNAEAARLGVTLPRALPSPAAAPADVASLDSALTRKVTVAAADIPEKWKKELSKEMRARGRPRDDTVTDTVADLSKRAAVVARLRSALEHAARLGAALASPHAGAWAGMAASLEKPNSPEGLATLRAILVRSLGVTDVPPPPEPSFRDDLRDRVLPQQKDPQGMHVLQLDLAAACWEASLKVPNGLNGVDQDDALDLCAHAAGLAVRAVVVATENTTEETRLQEAAKQAIRDRAEGLPSRQRRELADAWVRSWNELLTRACRAGCNQQCLAHLKDPMLDAAFSLEHPRLNIAWPG